MTEPAVTWEPSAEDGTARSGALTTPHGTVATPLFMPVATRGTVKGLTSDDMRDLGTGVLLANTYHLMLRPGDAVVERLGGLHSFMSWDGPILTDSGGFQIFSLDPAIDDRGARFRSVYDGSIVEMTPEDSVAAQEALGSDIAMVLDVCVALPAPAEVVEVEMRRTLEWAERCVRAHRRSRAVSYGPMSGPSSSTAEDDAGHSGQSAA